MQAGVEGEEAVVLYQALHPYCSRDRGQLDQIVLVYSNMLSLWMLFNPSVTANMCFYSSHFFCYYAFLHGSRNSLALVVSCWLSSNNGTGILATSDA